jgi:putative ABC transport system permease protein
MSKNRITQLAWIARQMRRTPLAWLQLTYRTGRFCIAAMGIAFSVMLIFVQLGLSSALYISNTVLHQHLRGDIVLVSSETETLIRVREFPLRRLYQALGFPGVASVNPVYYHIRNFKNLANGRARGIAVFGIDPLDSPFEFPDLDQQLDTIKLTDVVLFDRNSRPEYGPVAEDFEAGRPIAAEILGHRIKIGGVVDFTGPSFGIDGSIITSDYNFHRFFGDLDPENLALGLITLKPDANLETVVKILRQQLPQDVQVLTIEDYVNLEVDYWQRTTPIGFVFSMGVIIGFLVGVFIVYQILNGEISDHISDYAILKSKGYPSRYFFVMVLQESLILSISGYIPGYFLARLLYAIVGRATNIPVVMETQRSLLMLALTIVMCLISGAIVVNKLQEADPADLL